MTGFNYRPKMSAEMQQRIGELSKHDRFHSHAVAKVDPNGKTIGSAAQPESFEQRRERERNREHVGHYGHSRIGIFGHKPGTRRKPVNSAEAIRLQHSPSQSKPELNARINPNTKPTTKPQPSFREPPTRGYNPYS